MQRKTSQHTFVVIAVAIILAGLPFAIAQNGGAAWQISEVATNGDRGDYAQMAFDENGYPHIAHVNFTNEDLILESWNGVAWETKLIDQEVPSSGNFDPQNAVDLKIDSGGAIHVAYISDLEASDLFNTVELRYAVLGQGSAFFEKTTLHSDRALIPDAFAVGLALDSRGIPHILLAQDVDSPQLLHFHRPAPDAEWQSENVAVLAGLIPLPSQAFGALAFEIDNDDRRHALLVDESDNELYQVTGEADGSWTAAGIPPVGADYHTVLSDLVIDSEGNLHALSARLDSGILSYRMFDGAAWQTEEVASSVVKVERVPPSFDLALDSTNRPHVVYRVGKGWFYATKADGAWSSGRFLRNIGLLEGNPPAGELGFAIPGVDLEIDSDDRPCVAIDSDRPFANLLFAKLTNNPWTIMTPQEGNSDARIQDPSLAVSQSGDPHVSYHFTPDRAGVENELRYTVRNADTGEWAINTVLANAGADRGVDTSATISAVSSFSQGNLQTEFSVLSNGEWTTEPVTIPADLASFHGNDLIIHRFLRRPEIFGTVRPGGIAVATKEDGAWNVFPYSPLEPNALYTYFDAVSPEHSAYSGHYFVIYASRFTIFMAVWDGTEWIHNEPVSTTLLPGAFPVAAAIDWDESLDRPVVVFSRNRGPTSRPIEIARRATGEPEPSSWDIDPVFNPGFPFFDLEFHSSAGREIVAFSGLLRPVQVLTREAGADTWTASEISGPLGSGTGLDLEVANGLDWIALASLSFGGSPGLHVAFRPSSGALDTLAGTIDYGSGEQFLVHGFHPLAPCPLDDIVLAQVGSREARGREPRDHAKENPGDGDDLSLLRALRDMARETEAGLRLINLYYEHRSELVDIGTKNPMLAFRTLNTMRNFLPGVVALTTGHGDTVTVTEDMVAQAQAVFEQIAAKASPVLKSVVDTELQRFNQLEDFAGLDFDRAAEQLGVVEQPGLRVLGVALAGERITIEVELLPGFAYSLWKRPSLATGDWQPVIDAEITAGNGRVRLEEEGVEEAELYYQVRAISQP